QVIGHLVRGNREEVRLKLALVVEVGEGIEEADERLLDDVLGRGAVADAPDREGHQPALVQVDEPLPGGLVAPADLLDEYLLGFGGHAATQLAGDVECAVIVPDGRGYESWGFQQVGFFGPRDVWGRFSASSGFPGRLYSTLDGGKVAKLFGTPQD